MRAPVTQPTAGPRGHATPGDASRQRWTTSHLAARTAAAVGLALLLLPLLHAWTTAPVWLGGALAAVAALAACRPAESLLVVAGLVPLTGTFAAAQRTPLPAGELLVLAACAGWTIRTIARPAALLRAPADVLPPVLLLAMVVITSAIVELWGQRALLGPDAFAERVEHVAASGFLLDRPALRPVGPAIVFLESLALFAAAAAVCARHGQMAARIAAMAVAGAAGAAVLNLLRLVNAVIAAEAPWQRLHELLATVRFNVHFGDVNAAGSYFALLIFPAAAWWLGLSGWRRLPGAAVPAVLAAAAWLTGSRAAVGSILIVALVISAFAARRRHHARAAGIAALAACMAALTMFVTLFPNRLAGLAMSSAVEIRTALARVSLEMVAAEPLFGVGVGSFYDSSAPLLAETSIARFYSRENAHNNYLQLLAELGLVGFGVLLWLLWRLAIRIRHTPVPPAGPRTAAGLAAGLAAFGLTALTGHPLLTPEVSLPFWLLLGTALGLWSPLAPGPPAVASRSWRAAGLIGLLLVAALPVRFPREVAGLDLEGTRYGVSGWTTDADGRRYQSFDARATFYVPTGAAARIPVREPDASPGSLVELHLNGRLVDRIQTGSDWRFIRILPPPAAGNRRFVRVDLVPAGGAVEPRKIHVGRTEVTPK